MKTVQQIAGHKVEITLPDDTHEFVLKKVKYWMDMNNTHLCDQIRHIINIGGSFDDFGHSSFVLGDGIQYKYTFKWRILPASTLDFKLLARIRMWNDNRAQDEALTLEDMAHISPSIGAHHLYDKWYNVFKQDIMKMVCYLQSDPDDGQRFLDRAIELTEKYENNRGK